MNPALYLNKYAIVPSTGNVVYIESCRYYNRSAFLLGVVDVKTKKYWNPLSLHVELVEESKQEMMHILYGTTSN